MEQVRYLKKLSDYFRFFFRAMRSGFAMSKAGFKKTITPDFAERIMLAVTGVNKCAYCSWLHTKTALEKGIPQKEIQGILRGEFGNVPEREAAALLYAQHYAETGGRPAKDAAGRITELYGKDGLKYINCCINMVYFGNMCSNTVEYHEGNQKRPGGLGRIIYTLSKPVAGVIKKGSGREN